MLSFSQALWGSAQSCGGVGTWQIVNISANLTLHRSMQRGNFAAFYRSKR